MGVTQHVDIHHLHTQSLHSTRAIFPSTEIFQERILALRSHEVWIHCILESHYSSTIRVIAIVKGLLLQLLLLVIIISVAIGIIIIFYWRARFLVLVPKWGWGLVQGYLLRSNGEWFANAPNLRMQNQTSKQRYTCYWSMARLVPRNWRYRALVSLFHNWNAQNWRNTGAAEQK
jgi:hypothetical protein